MAIRPLGEHRFGSKSTDLKLSIVEGYLKAFTTALRRKYPALWYIDAFAGTGERTVKHDARPADMFAEAVEERIEARRGSALIALKPIPAFDRLIFMDIRARHCKALERLRAEYPDRQIDVIKGDANDIIEQIVRARRWSGTRAVILLDPYGMHIDWATLEAIRKTEAMDVWYLVSLEGLWRQASIDPAKLTAKKREAITRMVGTDDWQTAWYGPKSAQGTLDLGIEETRRTASVDDIADYFLGRLRSLFPTVLKPLRLKNKGGAPAFALFFAMSNPDPKATRVATRIASQILKSGMASHV